MWRRVWGGFLLLLAFFSLQPCGKAVAGVVVPPPGYRLSAHLPLTLSADGVAGCVELLVDERLDESVARAWWGGNEVMWCDPLADTGGDVPFRELCASIAARPLRGALLRLLDPSGDLLDERTFDRELGALELMRFSPSGHRRLLVTIDRSTEAGSWNGPVTELADVSGSRFRWERALSLAEDSSGDLRLLRSLKSDWCIAEGSPEGARDILAVCCVPSFDRNNEVASADLSFDVSLRRYILSGDQWWLRERREPGWWENDSGFPPTDAFPQ